MQLLSTVLLDGLRPAILGLFLGLAASAATVRLIASMLYQTEPLDPAVFASVTTLASGRRHPRLPASGLARLAPRPDAGPQNRVMVFAYLIPDRTSLCRKDG